MINAIHYYIKHQHRIIWFRDSTQEWVVEIDISVPNEFCLTSRYTHKYKLCAMLRFALSCRKDIIRIKNVL